MCWTTASCGPDGGSRSSTTRADRPHGRLHDGTHWPRLGVSSPAALAWHPPSTPDSRAGPAGRCCRGCAGCQLTCRGRRWLPGRAPGRRPSPRRRRHRVIQPDPLGSPAGDLDHWPGQMLERLEAPSGTQVLGLRLWGRQLPVSGDYLARENRDPVLPAPGQKFLVEVETRQLPSRAVGREHPLVAPAGALPPLGDHALAAQEDGVLWI
jgi:hypothetical protein